MKILKVDKDAVQVELRKEEIEELADGYNDHADKFPDAKTEDFSKLAQEIWNLAEDMLNDTNPE